MDASAQDVGRFYGVRSLTGTTGGHSGKAVQQHHGRLSTLRF